MPELFDRGHVYIAVPPLYLVKLGNREQYVEKESQFEELLVRERVKDMVVTDSAGQELALTEARWARFVRALGEFDGWYQRLRSDFGAPAGDFVVAPSPGRNRRPTDAGARPRPRWPKTGLGGEQVRPRDRRPPIRGQLRALKASERATNAAQFVTVPSALLRSPVYSSVRRAYAAAGVSVVGRPPFTVVHGKKQAARRPGSPISARPRSTSPRTGSR